MKIGIMSIKLSNYLSEAGISLNIAGQSKSDILSSLVGILEQLVSLKDSAAIIKMLEERENLKTTGIGSGIAIPHCKSPDVDKVYVVIGLSKEGIDFQSLDNKPAHFFFLLVAPEKSGSEHLKASAKIVRLIRDEDVRKELLELGSAKEVIEYIKLKED